MVKRWIAAVALVPLAGCPDSKDPDFQDAPTVDADQNIDGPPIDAVAVLDGPAGSNAGFIVPTFTTRANTFTGGAWSEVGPADWSCLGTPSTDAPSTGTIALSGTVRDFQTGNGVGNAEIFAWSTSPQANVGVGNSSDAPATRGNYTMTLGALPTGTTRYGFSVSAPSFGRNVLLDNYYPPGAPATDDLVAISDSTRTAIPAFVGVTVEPNTVLYLGDLRDCLGRAVSNAAVGISFQRGAFVDAGGTTFYFSASSTSLPVRHNVAPVLNRDGRFAVLNTPPLATAVLQIWGFPTEADLAAGTLVLLAELAAPGAPDDAIHAALAPRRN